MANCRKYVLFFKWERFRKQTGSSSFHLAWRHSPKKCWKLIKNPQHVRKFQCIQECSDWKSHWCNLEESSFGASVFSLAKKPIRTRVPSKIPPWTPIVEVARTAIGPLCLKEKQNQTCVHWAPGDTWQQKQHCQQMWVLQRLLCKLKWKVWRTYLTFQGHVDWIKTHRTYFLYRWNANVKELGSRAHKDKQLHYNTFCQVQTWTRIGHRNCWAPQPTLSGKQQCHPSLSSSTESIRVPRRCE